MSTPSTQIIEHIVLFKLKPTASPTTISSMFTSLNALSSLDSVLHLTAGQIHNTHHSTTTTSLSFTHFLHARYSSKQSLHSYAVHPAHVSVVQQSAPLLDDVMAVDWVVDDLSGPVGLTAGAAVRVVLVKMKEGLGEKERRELVGGFGEFFSVGENFSPGRAKGFSVAVLAVFGGGVDEIEGKSVVGLVEERGGDLVESMLVVDFVVPATESGSA